MSAFNPENRYQDLDFKSLRSKCQDCRDCKLHSTRNNVVFGSGNPDSILLAIGEGPGEQEDLQGNPFVGRSGKLLTEIFQSVDLNRETDLFITNIVKCRPPNNRDPQPDEISACSDILSQQIQTLKPRIILLIGSPAMKTILGPDHRITKARGQWFKEKVDYMDDLVYIMPIFHPSYLLRNASKEIGKPKWQTWQDMIEVKKAYDYFQTL